MAKALSRDLRERIRAACDPGESSKPDRARVELREWLGLSIHLSRL